MNIQQSMSASPIKFLSTSWILAMPKTDPPGIEISVLWMTLTSGSQYFIRIQKTGTMASSTKHVIPKETLNLIGILNFQRGGSTSQGLSMSLLINIQKIVCNCLISIVQKVQEDHWCISLGLLTQMQKQGWCWDYFKTIQKLRSRRNSFGCFELVIGDLKEMRAAWDYRMAPHSFIQNLVYSYIFLIPQPASYLFLNIRPCISLYYLIMRMLIKGIQNVSFFAREKDFLFDKELTTVLMACSVVFTAVLLIIKISLLGYFSLICIRKFKGFSQKKHLICCFCWKYLAQNDQTGLSLNRKLLSFLNQNLFKKVADLARQVYDMKSFFVISSFTLNDELNLFFSYLFISLIVC